MRSYRITFVGGPFCGIVRSAEHLHEVWKVPTKSEVRPAFTADGAYVPVSAPAPVVSYRLVYGEDGQPSSNDAGEYRYAFDPKS